MAKKDVYTFEVKVAFPEGARISEKALQRIGQRIFEAIGESSGITISVPKKPDISI